MTISNENLTEFITNFFSLHDCNVIHQDDGVLNVELTEEMDKALMNRPFYWQYVKSTGLKGEPMNITLITNVNKQDQNGEWIHFGSPRLQQIFTYLRQTAQFTKLFQAISTTTQTPLFPWLVINIKISYTGKLRRDELFSLGLNLVNGMMKVNMMDELQSESFHLHISDYCYPISPIIKLQSGFKRIEAVLDQYVENNPHEWATDSLKELAQEKELIHYFYQDGTDEEKLQKEIEEVTLRYTPTITYEVVNGGLFYLDERFSDKTELQ